MGPGRPSPKCFLRRAASLFFFVMVLIYVPIMKATKLKNGIQANSGKNC